MEKPKFGNLEAETIDVNAERSIAVVALTGLNRPALNAVSDMEYEVLRGEGCVEIDFKVIELRPGSVFHVSAGTPYQDEALTPRLLMRVKATPRFNTENVEYLA